ncbi:MAG: hypothetical protein WBX07_17115 [Rhodoplanes sp.]
MRTLDQLKADPTFRDDAEDGMIVGLPIDLPGKAVRVNVSLDENLVAAADRAARRAGSAFLAAAAKAKFGG